MVKNPSPAVLGKKDYDRKGVVIAGGEGVGTD
jgi:hypothetical protein